MQAKVSHGGVPSTEAHEHAPLQPRPLSLAHEPAPRAPACLAQLVPKGREDCGRHDWYRDDGTTARCYHCEVGERTITPSIDVLELYRQDGREDIASAPAPAAAR